jgi:transcription antitermination factor NusG
MAELRLSSSPMCEALPGSGRHWFAAYTKPRHEAIVAKQLEAKTVGFLLPVYARTARWSDRLKRGMAPLFPSYVFVNVNSEERVRVLRTAGVVNIVSIAGKPYPLSDEEVAMLQECAARPRAFEPHPFLRAGQRVRVKQGPFAGWVGTLSYKKNGARLVISLEHIMRSVSVELAGTDVEAIN